MASKNFMTIINFVNSELGGVGKSTFTSMLYEYYIKKNKAIRLIDTDRLNPNLGIKYFASLNLFPIKLVLRYNLI